nr:MAG TPA: hypothetical protein [Caudoviricetes sp.]
MGSFLVRKIHNKKDPPRLMCPYSKILTLIIIADSGGTSCKQI